MIKSHFQFTNQQRNGIFLLLLTIIFLQCVYVLTDFNSDSTLNDAKELRAYRKELDSLRSIEIENNKPKIYPFNPNFISDYKGYTLGMSVEEIDRLLKFREKGKWINSSKQFQEVTKISDSLLEEIKPNFKFPDWVSNPKKSPKVYSTNYSDFNKTKTFDQKTDLNKATASQLQKIYGIGKKLAKRILDYRAQHKGGFVSMVELSEVYGLNEEVIKRIKNNFAVKTPRVVNKLNVNTVNQEELVLIKYIDYEVANNIVEERTLRQGFKSLEELTKVEDFPVNKIEIIKLYLQL